MFTSPKEYNKAVSRDKLKLAARAWAVTGIVVVTLVMAIVLISGT